MSETVSLIAFAVIGILCVCALNHSLSRKQLPLPPGPSGWGLSGATSQIPKTQPWRKYKEWGVRYGGKLFLFHQLSHCSYVLGPLLSFRVFNKRIIIINDGRAMHDLLNKRAATYSDRPKAWMFHELCDRKKTVFNIASNARHRMYRKILQSGLGPKAIQKYTPIMEAEVDTLVEGLRSSPSHYEAHIRRLVIYSKVTPLTWG